MTSQTQGIQQLLAAEKIAAEKVTDARKRKAKRLKQAKDEAQDEIEKYRVQREKQFREYETKYMGSREDIQSKIDAEAEDQLKQMDINVANNKEKVIAELLALVCDIEPEVHRNYRPPNMMD